MSWREVKAEDLFSLRNPLIIDVRSPCEHRAESIPLSANVPLLDDAERAEVGTVYAGEGEITARRLALRMISPKIPSIVDEILSLKETSQNLVIHCWRGGLRSEAVASFLTIAGLDCWRLTGGYKAWRRFMLKEFADDNYSFQPIILHGHTGVGKTDILNELAKLGEIALDLEHLANHRGSAFGGIGLREQPTQKNFEASLWHALREVHDQTVYIEAESRKIGKLSVPDLVLTRIKTGKKVLVTGSMRSRSQRIQTEYAGNCKESFDTVEQAFSQLTNLKERIGSAAVVEVQKLVVLGCVEQAVKILLETYYDPLYEKQIKQYEPFDLEVSGDDPHAAAATIRAWAKADQTKQAKTLLLAEPVHTPSSHSSV